MRLPNVLDEDARGGRGGAVSEGERGGREVGREEGAGGFGGRGGRDEGGEGQSEAGVCAGGGGARRRRRGRRREGEDERVSARADERGREPAVAAAADRCRARVGLEVGVDGDLDAVGERERRRGVVERQLRERGTASGSAAGPKLSKSESEGRTSGTRALRTATMRAAVRYALA